MALLSKKNNVLLLIVLLILVALIGYSILRKESHTEGMITPAAFENTVMPSDAINSPDLDYEIIYGGAQDQFGMGPGASPETTNDWTLL